MLSQRAIKRVIGTLVFALVVASACASKSADGPAQPPPGTKESAGSDRGADPAEPTASPTPVSTSERAPRAPEPPPQVFNTVAASALEPLRLAGDPNIVPSDTVRKAIVKSGNERVRPAFKVCVDAAGNVSSTSMIPRDVM